MIRFQPRFAAVTLLTLAGIYMVSSLVSDRSARSEPLPDLTTSAADAGLDVFKTAAAMLGEPGNAMVVDVRRPEEFALYHLPGAVSEPGIDNDRLVQLAREHPPVIVVAATDRDAQTLVGEARGVAPDARVHYLVDGPRSWYLAFELPVPLFADAAAPAGYVEALATVRESFVSPGGGGREGALEAVQRLAKMDFQPTLLKQTGKPKAATGPRRKISGGCGS